MCPKAHEGEKAQSLEDSVDCGVGEPGNDEKDDEEIGLDVAEVRDKDAKLKRMTSTSCKMRGPVSRSTSRICGEGERL